MSDVFFPQGRRWTDVLTGGAYSYFDVVGGTWVDRCDQKVRDLVSLVRAEDSDSLVGSRRVTVPEGRWRPLLLILSFFRT